jgi:lysozyme family protein
MADFIYAIQPILENEGGLVNNQNDRGGMTNKGISYRFLREIYPHLTDAELTPLIKEMTDAQASYLYYKHFWQRLRLDEIYHQNIATKVFDMAVNMGNYRAVTILQRCSNIALKENLLSVDGIIGSKTISAVNTLGREDLEDLLCSECATFYANLAQQNPSQKVFLNGWLTRAAKRYREGIK